MPISKVQSMQFELDQAKSEDKLRYDAGNDGHKEVIVLTTRQMIADAVTYGHGRPVYMDATHGLQKYGLKIIAMLVKDTDDRGEHSTGFQISPCVDYLRDDFSNILRGPAHACQMDCNPECEFTTCILNMPIASHRKQRTGHLHQQKKNCKAIRLTT
jgi:hypothetical protein